MQIEIKQNLCFETNSNLNSTACSCMSLESSSVREIYVWRSCQETSETTWTQETSFIAKFVHFQESKSRQQRYLFQKHSQFLWKTRVQAYNYVSLVKQHQDSMYFITDPVNVLGFWIPIEDATVNNSCLWFIKGSHKLGLLNR